MISESEQFESGFGAHLSEEALLDYHLGRLDDTGREILLTHLVECDTCLATFKDVRAFVDQPGAGEHVSLGEGISQEWGRFWGQITDEKERAAIPQQRQKLSRNFWAASAMAAALAVALGATALWAVRLRQENRHLAEQSQTTVAQLEEERAALRDHIRQLEQDRLQPPEQATPSEQLPRPQQPPRPQPELNLRIYDILPRDSARRSAEGQANTIELPPTGEPGVLILNGAGQPTYPAYAIEVRDSRGRLIWRDNRLKRDNYGNFVVAVNRSFLGRGTYSIKLRGQKGGASEEVAEYLIKVE